MTTVSLLPYVRKLQSDTLPEKRSVKLVLNTLGKMHKTEFCLNIYTDGRNTNLANGYPLSICIKDELENSLLKIQGFADGNSGISLVKADGIVHRMFINSDGRFRFGTYSNGIWNIADVITNADIQAGNTPLGDCVPGKTTDFQIIFPKPFSSIPKVMVCLRSSSQSEKYGLLTPYVANISKTSFTFRVANAHTTLLTPGGTWYAML
jgi:hypothetical protein